MNSLIVEDARIDDHVADSGYALAFQSCGYVIENPAGFAIMLCVYYRVA